MLRKGIHLKEDGRFNKESYIHNLYKYHEKKRTYIELISYDKLILDAEKRNKVLFEKLGI